MLNPIKPYRIQWDPFLDNLQVAGHVGPHDYLVYHRTKPSLKGLLSARDSIDVVKLGETDKYYYVAAGSISEHPDYPPASGVVRIFQYPCGYVVQKIAGDPTHCKFIMVFHADLMLHNLVNFVADMVKPTLMSQKIGGLRKGTKTIKVSEEDLGLARDTKYPNIS